MLAKYGVFIFSTNHIFRHPIVLLSCVALFWGGNAIAGKLAVGHVSPMILTALRWLFAVIFISPFAIARVREQWPIIRKHLVMLFLFGAFGFAGFNALFYYALNYTTAINVTIEQSIMPLIVFFGNFDNLVDFTRMTEKVYQDDGTGSVGNVGFYGVWYHVQR